VLATIGLYTRVLPWLQKRFKNRSPQQLARWASAALLLIVIPVNVYLIAWRFIDLRRAEYPFYVPVQQIEAFDYLETQVASDNVVLSSLDNGQYVPALTGARSFLGHWAQTLDFFTKRELVADFFNAETSDSARRATLEEFNVSYVLFGEKERELAQVNEYELFDIAGADYLEEVFSNDTVTVYRVTLTS